MPKKPLIAITMGDPAGVGPEVVVKALATGLPARRCTPLVIGDAKVLQRVVAQSSLDWQWLFGEGGQAGLLNLDNIALEDFEPGQVGKEAGRASVEYILKGIDLALSKEVAALVTGPISKEAINLAGFHYPGHTEILAERTGTKEYGMLLVAGQLKVLHLSWHLPLRQACELVTKERVVRTLRLAQVAARQLGILHPRIGVAGLNPHAGEAGLMGQEEEEAIAPAVEEMAREGLKVNGPLPPDTLFLRAYKGEFDLLVAMYHDQGHIPAKLIAFDRAVNVTVGLPIIRTSVAHGTAFDIAGKGLAQPGSLLAAIRLAARMARASQRRPGLS